MPSTKIPLIFSPSLLTRSVQGHMFSVPRRRRLLGEVRGVAAARAAQGRLSLIGCGVLRQCQIPTMPWCVWRAAAVSNPDHAVVCVSTSPDSAQAFQWGQQTSGRGSSFALAH
jgi:hypothetical protein